MKLLSANQLKSICITVLKAAGTPKDEAETVTESLVKANLRARISVE